MTVVDELLALSELPDIMSAADQVDLAALQLEAARQRFDDHRQRIGILSRRAGDSGISEVTSRQDLVPLLFAHTVYKSYPPAWLYDGRWDRMTQWFQTVSATSMDGVDLATVADVDDWLDRLAAAGHHAFSSSGTSGRASFVDQDELDLDRVSRLLAIQFGWPRPVPITSERAVFFLTPSRGPGRIIYGFQAQAKYHGRAGEAFALTDEPLRMGVINRIMAIEAAIAAGTASPSTLAELESAGSAIGSHMAGDFERFGERIAAYRDQPIVFHGQWPQAYRLVETMRRQGYAGGGWHPESVLFFSGGTKGVPLPPDYREQVVSFFSPGRQYQAYGMSETSTHAPMCERGRYHTPPWQILLVLDDSGEHLAPTDAGPVSGRGAVMDMGWDGHWGGLIGGDWVTVDYGRCPCGRPGPTIEDSVVRYADRIGAEDDKLSCAAALDMYVRSALRVTEG